MSELPRSGWTGLPPWIRGLTILGIAAAGLSVPGYFLFRDDYIARNERAASAALKILALAQADFRGNDRDGNRIQDFWTGDVAGLLATPGGPLFDPAIVAADALPLLPRVPVPYHGYYFQVMRTDASGFPYQVDTGGVGSNGRKLWNYSRFAMTAYPEKVGVTGRHTFIVNEGNTIYKEDNGGRPRLAWPPEEEGEPAFGDPD